MLMFILFTYSATKHISELSLIFVHPPDFKKKNVLRNQSTSSTYYSSFPHLVEIYTLIILRPLILYKDTLPGPKGRGCYVMHNDIIFLS